MKILIVGSLNSHAGEFAPFVLEQAEALRAAGCEIEYFGVTGKGVKGYLKTLPLLKAKIKEVKPDVIHAHYGMSSLLANLQRMTPVVSTYHGSDINEKNARRFSKIAMRLSAWNIFVSQRTLDIAKPGKRYSLIPCGINLPKDKSELPDMSRVLEPGKKHVLFAGAFDNKVKDYPLAAESAGRFSDPFRNQRTVPLIQHIELKGYTRDEVNALMYACDAFLMTSKTEGSPQVIKEAMACGCPIVSVDVGDVAEITKDVDGCFITERNAESIAKGLQKALSFEGRTKGRERIIELGLTNDQIAKKIIEIYGQYLSVRYFL